MDGEEAGVMMSGPGQCPREGGAKCGRWNPTAQQVKVLMDLFRSGLRTPSTEQIQSITSHLSSLGKIETKNVFYWFQNHKARERYHKKRRRGPAPAAADADTSVLPPHKREAKNVYVTAAGVDAVLREPDERKIETLELFPIKSYDVGLEKVTTATATARNECREIPLFDGGRDLLLDLRLSFL